MGFYSEKYITHRNIGWAICIKNYVEELDDHIDFMFKMFEISDKLENNLRLPGAFIIKNESDMIYRLSYDDSEISSSNGLSGILGELYEVAFLPVFLENSYWWYLHGGAVSYNGKAIIISGTTHAGKTTMISTLCTKGGSYLTDDIVPINVETLKVSPFPHPVASRNIGHMEGEVLSRHFSISAVKMLGKNKHHPGGDEKFILNPKRFEDIEGLIPAKAVVLLKRMEGYDGVCIKKLSSGEAFIKLLLNSRHPQNMAKNRKVAARLSNKVQVYEIEYSESIDAASHILEFLFGGEENNEQK
ncbi:MAG TPA: hypothetical protein VIO64_08925 [Pseudobacteroides sp.]|uniref:hypothetical protein n=1 Tax=Pseudobacteroides sp. TaxID=1968840 RepID=UPI002F95F857